MLSYVLMRLLVVIPTLIGITLVVFTVVTAAPGDPAANRASEIQDPEQSERVRAELIKRYRLDEPVLKRYVLWVGDLVTFDLGNSISDDNPVADKIAKAFWPTVSVNLVATILAFLISVPIGLGMAARRNGWFDRIGGAALYGLYSIPSYVGAIILIYYLGVSWDLLPFSGMTGDDYHKLSGFGKFMDITAHMTLYVICAMYGSLAFYSRFVRQNLLEVVRQDFIRTARAKGLSGRTVIVKHAFRNSLIPLLTLMGLVVPGLLGGSVILEAIFTWPGLGKLFIESIYQRDFPTLMALSTASAVLVLLSTLVVDLLYGVVDPRVSQR
ncbi:MAG: ABC transporter permease [Planctomycetota bacterium]